jgi:D-tyrosyl-tRNA(Tyr) deacylase
MRALVQRVSRAGVSIEGGKPRSIRGGLVIFLGVGQSDQAALAGKLADKIANLRIFSNAEGKFDRSLLDEKGQALVVSQFTLYGQTKAGRRPDFTAAARPEIAKPIYETFVSSLKNLGLRVETGEFGAKMEVELVNDGPVTIWIDSEQP